ncbi:MAG: hypothetical protein HUU29_14525, partial [Planctomycetaceae bacterium]|nr:hypothetical protein [Planctomycetaceae bacterium]
MSSTIRSSLFVVFILACAAGVASPLCALQQVIRVTEYYFDGTGVSVNGSSISADTFAATETTYTLTTQQALEDDFFCLVRGSMVPDGAGSNP